MSGGLAPSKSTVYVSNLPFSLTNNDIHQIFQKHGKVVKVTVLKDKNRKSRGVAFILFLEREDAWKCVRAVNNTVMFGRTLKCNIAKDNGRASEFIRRQVYPDKTRCYECGEEGHVSFKCPKNLLGDREPPKKKDKRKKDEDESSEEEEKDDEEGLDSLAAAIKFQQAKMEEAYTQRLSTASLSSYTDTETEPKRKKYKKDAYFSDEEELDGD